MFFKKNVFLFAFIFSATVVIAFERKIPILISDHHADHALWIYKEADGAKVSLVLLDAHSDAAENEDKAAICERLKQGKLPEADSLIKNHNWIHPLTPRIIDSFFWIHTIYAAPNAGGVRGFLASASSWGMKKLACLALDELANLPPAHDGNSALFISIDLDFFCSMNHAPEDVPHVFERLLDFSRNWNGQVFWAISASLAWQPDLESAWVLLEQSLRWLSAKPEFETPKLTLFDSYRHDTSRMAQFYRAGGNEPPSFYSREGETPDRIKELLPAVP